MSKDSELMSALKDFHTEFELTKVSCSKLTHAENQDNKENGSSGKALKMSSLLESYLEQVACTGQSRFPWKIVKPVFLVALDTVMRDYDRRTPFSNLPKLPNCRDESFEMLYSTIMVAADSFHQAPFTLQRLCELVCFPDKHYKKIDKFLRAIEKNILVVTTVSEDGSRAPAESVTEMLAPTSKQPTSVVEVFDWINKSIPKDLPTETAVVSKRKFTPDISGPAPKSARIEDDKPAADKVSGSPVPEPCHNSKVTKRSLNAMDDSETVEDSSQAKRIRTEPDIEKAHEETGFEVSQSEENTSSSDGAAAVVSADQSSSCSSLEELSESLDPPSSEVLSTPTSDNPEVEAEPTENNSNSDQPEKSPELVNNDTSPAENPDVTVETS